jgi:hypothetical protein
MRVEIEVEYVRRQVIEFDVDIEEGMSQANVDVKIGRFMRSLQYHMHYNKDLVKGEHPRLIMWQFMEICKECGQTYRWATCSDHDSDGYGK